jgi:hypothetical protein
MQMRGKRLLIGLLLLFLYFATVSILVYLSYRAFPAPTTADEYKEFGVRAGLALSAVGAFFGFAVSFFTLSTQLDAAKDLERLKGDITKRLAFKTQALNSQSAAYDKAFIASENCYRQLQRLANGDFNEARLSQLEDAFNEAKALSANLPKEDQAIVTSIQQEIFNVADEAKKVTSVGADRTTELNAIWERHAKELGAAIKQLRDRSLFFAEDVRQKAEDIDA